MILTGRTVMAEEALRIGLVNRVVDRDMLGAAVSLAREMTCFSLPALGFARDAVRRGLPTSLKERDRSRPQHARFSDRGCGRRHDRLPR